MKYHANGRFFVIDEAQGAQRVFYPKNFYHWGDNDFQAWNRHKNHALCSFLEAGEADGISSRQY